MKATFEAKRVIVAACAAIAMVLGTMSVSSTVSSPDSAAQTGEVSAIINSETLKQKKPASADFSHKHTLEVRNFLQQQDTPLYATPSPGSTASKTRKSLLPAFSIVSPIFFINQIVQSGQEPALPGAEAPAASDSNKTDTGVPSEAVDPAKPDDTGETATPTEGEESTEPTPSAEDRSTEPMSTLSTDMATSE